MDGTLDLTKLSPTTIDDILDEIDENEEKENKLSNYVNWDEIINEIRNGNLNKIKNLITSNDISINTQNPINGKTLLIYGVIIGNIDLIKVICNYGADVHIKDIDGMDALDYAIKYGRYKITELVYYQQLSGSLGNNLKNIARKIHDKNKEARLMNDFKFDFVGRYGDSVNVSLSIGIVEYMIEAIKKRAPFSADLLYYAWYFILNGDTVYQFEKGTYGKCDEPLSSKLWTTMMNVYEEILSNTSDKAGWEWLKTYVTNSLIWYLPHPNYYDKNEEKNDEKNEENNDENNEENNDENVTDANDESQKVENVLKSTLFWELLSRVRTETKRQSDILLRAEINAIQENEPNEWKQLREYNLETKYSKTARQDSCGNGCLMSKYMETELSKDIYPPSTHFSAKKHYDTNIYLNELIFRANIVNDMFQNDMRNITKTINEEAGDSISFRMGPVKTLRRSQTKVENDYIHECYPTSAKILDINRCAIQFKTIPSMMNYIKIFTDKINKNNAGSISKIIRCKNGWMSYDPTYPQYTDIKLNVLVQSKNDGVIIAEVQFLLDLMSKFKKKAHKLYSIERKFEFVYNFGLLKKKMSKFKDIDDKKTVWIEIVTNDDLPYFKTLWNVRSSVQILLEEQNINKPIPINKQNSSFCNNLALVILLNEKGTIHDYLKNNDTTIYQTSLSRYFNNVSWHSFFAVLPNKLLFMQRLCDLFDNKLFISFGRLFESIFKMENQDLLECILSMKNVGDTKWELIRKLIIAKRSRLHLSGNIEFYKWLLLKIFVHFKVDEKLTQFVVCKTLNGTSIFTSLVKNCKGTNGELIKDILFNTRIRDSAKYKSLAEIFGNKIPSDFQQFIKLQNEQTDSNHWTILNTVRNMFDLFDNTRIIQHKTFNYFTLKTPNALNNSEFKYENENGYDSSLYCFGCADNGRLGLGDDVWSFGSQVDCLIPTFCGTFEQVSISAHGLAIDKNGFVHSWGSSIQQLDIAHSPKKLSFFQNIKIIQVAAGGKHSLILSKDGHVYTFGENICGQLGNNNVGQMGRIDAFNKLELTNIIEISTGQNHNCVISKDRKIFVWGNNVDGRCGISKPNKILQPTNINLNGRIPCYVDCGAYHTLILTSKNIVLSCGKTNYIGRKNENYIPMVIDTLKKKKVIAIAAGDFHNLCVTKNGELYTFGNGKVGQLGYKLEKFEKFAALPKKVQFFSEKKLKIVLCKAGRYHSAVVCNDSNLYIFGKSKSNNNLGYSDYIPKKIKKFENVPIQSIALGDMCTAIITGPRKLSSSFDEKTEKEEKTMILKSGQEINVEIPNYNLTNKQYKIFVRNLLLFKDTKWFSLQKQHKIYSPFPLYNTSFIDSLQINNQSIVVNKNINIEHVFHSEILNATYLLLINNNQQEIKKELIWHDNDNNKRNGLLYNFSDCQNISNIELKLPEIHDEAQNIMIYVQPQNMIKFSLLKEFNLLSSENMMKTMEEKEEEKEEESEEEESKEEENEEEEKELHFSFQSDHECIKQIDDGKAARKPKNKMGTVRFGNFISKKDTNYVLYKFIFDTKNMGPISSQYGFGLITKRFNKYNGSNFGQNGSVMIKGNGEYVTTDGIFINHNYKHRKIISMFKEKGICQRGDKIIMEIDLRDLCMKIWNETRNDGNIFQITIPNEPICAMIYMHGSSGKRIYISAQYALKNK
eukprot:74597_1